MEGNRGVQERDQKLEECGSVNKSLSTGEDNHSGALGASASGAVTASSPVAGGAKEYRFVIPSLPPSVNALYQIIYSQRRVELKPEAYRWKSDSKKYIVGFRPSAGSLIAVDVTFYYRFHYANGNPRVFDAANLLKLIIDCIAEKCGFNDCLVRHGSWSSVDSPDEKMEVVLREVER